MPNIFNTRVYILTIYFSYNSGSYYKFIIKEQRFQTETIKQPQTIIVF